MRRHAAVLAILIFACVAQSASAASWAEPQIRAAVASGLMGPSVAGFRPNDYLNRAELAQIVAGITREDQEVTEGAKAVTMTDLNRAIVRALGLAPAAEDFRAELAASGLKPPRRAGWEIVARMLELRFNHPAERDYRELLPNDAATRAEAANTVAEVLELSEWDLEKAAELAQSFDLPALTEWQRRVLERATRFIGYPYAWGGTSEGRQTLFGVTSRGGFDCSGFVWRVYRLEPWAGAPRLNSVLRGRTTYQMSGEVSLARRVGAARLRPADVIFFGARGARSRPAEVNHMGIYAGADWFIHSSGQGTTIAPLRGWYRDRLSWGRRPLAEAGLE